MDNINNNGEFQHPKVDNTLCIVMKYCNILTSLEINFQYVFMGQTFQIFLIHLYSQVKWKLWFSYYWVIHMLRNSLNYNFTGQAWKHYYKTNWSWSKSNITKASILSCLYYVIYMCKLIYMYSLSVHPPIYNVNCDH